MLIGWERRVEMMWIYPFEKFSLVSILLFALPARNIFASFFWAWLPVWPWVRWDSLWFEHKQWLCWAQALYSPEEQIQLFFAALNHANSPVNKHTRVSLRPFSVIRNIGGFVGPPLLQKESFFCVCLCSSRPVFFILHVVQFVFVWFIFSPSVVFTLQLVGQFIARAVSDQILSESYIDGYKGRVNCEYTRFVTSCS